MTRSIKSVRFGENNNNSVLSMTDKYNDYYDNELAKRFA